MVYIPGVSDDTLPAVAPSPVAALYLDLVDPEFYAELLELAASVHDMPGVPAWV